MALTKEQKGKLAREVGKLLGAFVRGAGSRKKSDNDSEGMHGVQQPAQKRDKSCGPCG